jgi:hypothetical protein
VVRHLSNYSEELTMADTQPARAVFGMTLAFAERALTKRLHETLAAADTAPSTWYALQLTAPTRPAIEPDAMREDLAGAPGLDAGAARTAVDGLVADGLIRVDEGGKVVQTADGEALHRQLRATVLGRTDDLLGPVPPDDLETTVRVLREVTDRARRTAPSRTG